ncbi:MAG TPA: hexitol phosphatase HxpB [Bacteroidales bacterium]|jgi:HAD superfamily hydrolase (TIGR01509 family)|nr:hexitol phosphatase HxpB [Bacteroidales bacterium]
MIQGIIFDLDGTLIDSEPLWQEAEIMVFEGEGLSLTREDCLKTKGLPSIEAVKFWHDKLINPKKEAALLTQELNHAVISIMKEKGKLKPGVLHMLDYWKSKGLPMGIASASSMAHIKTVVDKFNLHPYFDLIYSGDFEQFGKPHPGIYISACNKLKMDPVYSVAIEDSFNGILAAKSARMKVVALLDEGQHNDSVYDFSDLKIESLELFGDKHFNYLASLM